jgi:hypothetical protein
MTSRDGGRASAPSLDRKPAVVGPLPGRCARPRTLGLICGLLAVTFAGCSLSDGVGPYIVDPGRYSAYHCKDLVERLKALTTRQKELRDLMGKASEGGGGTVIGTLSYRPEYEKDLGEEKVLRRTAAEKKCALEPPTFESDQSIR